MFPYKKILIVGCPGAGKSTFARALHKVTDVPLYHLDNLYWNTDKTTVPDDIFIELLDSVLAQESWIIDGNFLSSMEHRLQKADLVIFLDYPTELCLKSVKGRIGTKRDDIPWIETEEDPEFMNFIDSFERERRPAMLKLFKKYPNVKVIIFTSREAAQIYLKKLQKLPL